MATILAHIRIKSGVEPAFELLSQELFRQSHASEKGLLRYEYWRSQTISEYYCLLSFVDFAAFLHHQSSPHHEGAAQRLMEMIADLRLEWVDPVQRASSLPPTRPQPVPADADALIRRYAEMMPVEVADWWSPLRTT